MKSDDRFGFEDVTNPARLGAAYASAIITQAEYALWELRWAVDCKMRINAIRRNRRWFSELAAEVASRVPA